MRSLGERRMRGAEREAVGERALVRCARETGPRELAAQAQVSPRQRVGARRLGTPSHVPGNDGEPTEEGEHERPAELARIRLVNPEALEDIELERVVELHHPV